MNPVESFLEEGHLVPRIAAATGSLDGPGSLRRAASPRAKDLANSSLPLQMSILSQTGTDLSDPADPEISDSKGMVPAAVG